jgi:hypothetical protein
MAGQMAVRRVEKMGNDSAGLKDTQTARKKAGPWVGMKGT